jgi:hypothetical protein
MGDAGADDWLSLAGARDDDYFAPAQSVPNRWAKSG